MVEDLGRIGRRLGLCGGDALAQHRERLLPHLLGELVRQQPSPSQVLLVAADALAPLLLLDAL